MEMKNTKKTFMKGKMETGDIGIWQNKITFFTKSLQSQDLQFFPIYGQKRRYFSQFYRYRYQAPKSEKIPDFAFLATKFDLHFFTNSYSLSDYFTIFVCVPGTYWVLDQWVLL